MIINLTPHNVKVMRKDGTFETFLPSGKVARVTQTNKKIGLLEDFDLVKQTFGDVVNLPEYKIGTWYIVSMMVFSAVDGDRLDILALNTSDAIRDEYGLIVGVPNFITK